MILKKPSIPYSLRIGGEWSQLFIISSYLCASNTVSLGISKLTKDSLLYLQAVGTCVLQLWWERIARWVSAWCTGKTGNEEQSKDTGREPQDTRESDDIINEVIRPNVDHLKIKIQSVIIKHGYEHQPQNLKRQVVTDSESDRAVFAHRTRLKPAPSLSTRRKVKKKTAKASGQPRSKWLRYPCYLTQNVVSRFSLLFSHSSQSHICKLTGTSFPWLTKNCDLFFRWHRLDNILLKLTGLLIGKCKLNE